jgi:hypothetical protein
VLALQPFRYRTPKSDRLLDERIIRQDCLCYLMERIALPEPAMQD